MRITIVRLTIHKQNYHTLVIKPHRETNPPWKLNILLFHLAQFSFPKMSDTAREICGESSDVMEHAFWLRMKVTLVKERRSRG